MVSHQEDSARGRTAPSIRSIPNYESTSPVDGPEIRCLEIGRASGSLSVCKEHHALRVFESLGWMPIIAAMANPQECQHNIRRIAAEKHIAPAGYEETIYLEKGSDGKWMATAMYSEGQIAENLSQFCRWINNKRQDLLPTVQKPPVKKIFGIAIHR